MAVTDPLGDLLTRIRNGQRARKDSVLTPASKLRARVLDGDTPDATSPVQRASRFVALATELGVAPAPLAIAWCLRNPHVSSVLLGASRVAQLLENLAALDLLDRFDAGTWGRIEASVG